MTARVIRVDWPAWAASEAKARASCGVLGFIVASSSPENDAATRPRASYHPFEGPLSPLAPPDARAMLEPPPLARQCALLVEGLPGCEQSRDVRLLDLEKAGLAVHRDVKQGWRLTDKGRALLPAPPVQPPAPAQPRLREDTSKPLELAPSPGEPHLPGVAEWLARTGGRK